MAAHIQHFILHIAAALAIEAEDLVFETLPLRLLAIGIILAIRIVGTIN